MMRRVREFREKVKEAKNSNATWIIVGIVLGNATLMAVAWSAEKMAKAKSYHALSNRH
jgi:hypothetical protein